jgi:thiol-disulfide isomerase/thioredoxin
MNPVRISSGAFILLLVWICQATVPAVALGDITVEEKYPGLAAGLLKKARLVGLEKGLLLTSKGVEIRESDLKAVVETTDANVRKELEKNLFFILEQQAMKKLLLYEALKSGTGKGESDEEDQVILKHLSEQVSGVSVSDDELKTFYAENKDAIGGMPLEMVKDSLKDYLLEQKRREAVAEYMATLGDRTPVSVNALWVDKQSALAKDNPVDRARSSGKPTMVEFGATGCKPCDMMQPILTKLKEKYANQLNVVFLHVGEEQILAARYGISSIPVQAFYDKNGAEVFRHVGFYPLDEVEKHLKSMGVK